ncbi:carbon-nitrogen hydrolase family protein [Pseudomonas sp.]|uniref:carbon-nitrogen hydrolase family protein n=1 Tax=Pseudomonas sp. TaxID=306 RepID=UPI0028A7B38C|nr:carbon-nitrogen hydrolase family protein [Pseudomonas sp.]
MNIVAAQIAPTLGSLGDSVERHLTVVERAAGLGAAALFFPELSLTGYAPSRAAQQAMHLDDARLEVFQRVSDRHRMSIANGVPTWYGSGVQISLMVFQPDQPRRSYAKQWLYTDEQAFFVPGDASMLFETGGYRLAPAICFESMQPEHAQAMADLGAQVYLASVAKSAEGVQASLRHYPLVARRHFMPVVMANAVGPVEGFVCAGGSGVWSSDGRVLCQAGTDDEALVCYDPESGQAEVVVLA